MNGALKSSTQKAFVSIKLPCSRIVLVKMSNKQLETLRHRETTVTYGNG